MVYWWSELKDISGGLPDGVEWEQQPPPPHPKTRPSSGGSLRTGPRTSEPRRRTPNSYSVICIRCPLRFHFLWSETNIFKARQKIILACMVVNIFAAIFTLKWKKCSICIASFWILPSLKLLSFAYSHLLTIAFFLLFSETKLR